MGEKIPTGYPESAEALLRELYPENNGYIEIRFIDKAKRLGPKQIFVNPVSTIDWDELRANNKQGYDVYFGVCSRKIKKGTKEALLSIPAFWIDLDAKDFHGNKEAAIDHLRKNLPEYLKPSIIIDSGHGYHIYWLFKVNEPIEDEKDIFYLESYLRGLARTFKGDINTCDLTRILRLPGFLNWKFPDKPSPVTILTWHPERRYTPSDFADYYEEQQQTPPEGTKSAKGSDETAVKKLFEVCAFLQHCQNNAVNLSEPHWWSMIHILTVFDEPGRQKIHELSQPYPRYTEKETNQKIKEAKKVASREIGPHTCAFIQQGLGFDCPKDCPAKKLKTKSPAGLALILAAQEPPSPYLYRDKSGWRLNIEKLVNDLLSEYSFKAMRDNEECLIYEDGIYTPWGEARIKEECEKRVPKKFISNHSVNEVIGHIKRSTYVDRKDFNQEKWILNLRNGLFDIRTGKLSPHTPKFLSTIGIPVAYDLKADCPQIRQFFTEVLREEDIPVIKELFGYCLIPDYTIQRAFLFIGDGANGKSTLLELLKHLLGADNCTNMSIQTIEYQRFAKATLFGKLANIYADIPSTRMDQVEVFKTLTGGDTIDGEKKFKERFFFTNTARLIFSTNKPPQVDEDTLAFWRRWIFINLPNKFMGGKADKQLLQKLTKKEELSGLLNIALGGLKRLLNKQDYSYELSPDEIAEWHRKASDPIYAFVEEVCEVNSDAWISKDDLYDTFISYCDKQNIPRIGIESFGRALKNAKNVHVIFKRRGSRGAQKTGWLGIQLRTQEGEGEGEEVNMEF